MSNPLEEPSPPPELPDDLVETVKRLTDIQLEKLARYSDALLEERTRPIPELIRETQDMDRIVRIEEQDGYASVVRRDGDDGTPNLYHVKREHHPDGTVDLNWVHLGLVVDE